jgi:hypothetical protein
MQILVFASNDGTPKRIQIKRPRVVFIELTKLINEEDCMSLSLRTHKGKQILYVDYGALNFKNMINLLYDSCHVLKKSTKKRCFSPILKMQQFPLSS